MIKGCENWKFQQVEGSEQERKNKRESGVIELETKNGFLRRKWCVFFFVLQCEGQLEKGNFFECGALSLSLSLSLTKWSVSVRVFFLLFYLRMYAKERVLPRFSSSLKISAFVNCICMWCLMREREREREFVLGGPCNKKRVKAVSGSNGNRTSLLNQIEMKQQSTVLFWKSVELAAYPFS